MQGGFGAIVAGTTTTTGTPSLLKPNYQERRAMMSEFASGLDPPPAKKSHRAA